MSVFQIASGRWRVQIRRKAMPSIDELYDTEEAALERQSELLGQAKLASDNRTLTIKRTWGLYLESSLYENKKLTTRKTEESRIKPVLVALGHCSLIDFEETPALIADYRDSRLRVVSKRTGKRLSADQVRLEIAALSSLMAFAIERRYLARNPLHGIMRPVGRRRKRRVSTTESTNLWLAARDESDLNLQQAARFLAVQLELGCRPGELAALRISDVYLAQSELVFRDTKDEHRDRRVNISVTGRNLLAAQISHTQSRYARSPFAFTTLTRANKPTVYNFSYAVKRVRAAKLVDEGYHSHANRREFVSRGLEIGLPKDDVKAQTGHRSDQAVDIYNQSLAVAPPRKKRLNDFAQSVDVERIESVLKRLETASSDERALILAALAKYKRPVEKL